MLVNIALDDYDYIDIKIGWDFIFEKFATGHNYFPMYFPKRNQWEDGYVRDDCLDIFNQFLSTYKNECNRIRHEIKNRGRRRGDFASVGNRELIIHAQTPYLLNANFLPERQVISLLFFVCYLFIYSFFLAFYLI